jgi:hypothetical protein
MFPLRLKRRMDLTLNKIHGTTLKLQLVTHVASLLHIK